MIHRTAYGCSRVYGRLRFGRWSGYFRLMTKDLSQRTWPF
jgi:hypothetical protein